MPPEFGRKWGMETIDSLNTRFPLPTLQCAGYNVKLIIIIDMVCLFVIIYKTIIMNAWIILINKISKFFFLVVQSWRSGRSDLDGALDRVTHSSSS